ncbi:hypothetical protein SDC9_181689 [bioreactor metagenome]|uniref:Uncharacterized protein n=1 Tax=bioreactor metagenome TaxID=1076179 RepID=A0A645H6S5_9ZZZZ
MIDEAVNQIGEWIAHFCAASFCLPDLAVREMRGIVECSALYLVDYFPALTGCELDVRWRRLDTLQSFPATLSLPDECDS